MNFFNKKEKKDNATSDSENKILTNTKINIEQKVENSDENSSKDNAKELTEKAQTTIRKTTKDEENSKEALIQKIAKHLNEYSSDIDNNLLIELQRKSITMDGFMERITSELYRYEAEYEYDKILTEEDEDQIIKEFQKKQFGYDIIEDYIDDDSISDIKILGPNNIQLKKDGKRIPSTRHFDSVEEFKSFASKVALKNDINTGINNAIQTFTDKKSSDKAILRIDYTSELINSTDLPYIVIRKIPKKKRNIEELINRGMMNEKIAEYLKEQAINSTGIIFTGKGASGKTTIMNALIDCIPVDRSGLVIQESEELFSAHPNMMFQHILTTKGDGAINYTLADLAVNGLLIDLDYFIIGEIKGEEASKFMTASYTGTKCWTSVHGTSSEDAITKLADYVKWASDYSLNDIYHMLRFMKVIVFMQDYKVYEISEIEGINNDGTLRYKPIVRHCKWVAA